MTFKNIFFLAFQQEVHGQVTTLQEIRVHSRQWRVPLVLLQDHLQKPSLWKNSYQPSLRKNSFLMMSIELECPVLGCKEGPGDAKWKSPLLLYEQAYIELDWHLLYNYPLTRSSNRSLSEYCFPNMNLLHRPPHAGVDKEIWGAISKGYRG